MNGLLVHLENVTKSYRLGKVDVKALKNVYLDITKGEFCILMGPSGSGKTTLLNLVGLIDYPTEGIVMVFGKNVNALSESQMCQLRREKFGFIFQQFSLLEVLTVEENVGYPLMLRGIATGQRKKKVAEVLEYVGLSGYQRRKPNTLSGGERQRVAIARALINEPEVVIADEFTANLDSKISKEILQIMKNYHSSHRTTFIIATHDPLVKQFAERVVYLKDGMIQITN